MAEEALYNQFAAKYDEIYAEKDYEKEVDFLETVFAEHNVDAENILELACGTGNHTQLLTDRGYRVVGVDKNKDMLSIAREKVPDAAFIQEDMRTVSLEESFDAVLCLFTAVNYVTDWDELVDLFEIFRSHLAKNGVAVFDGVAEARSEQAALYLDDGTVVLYDYEGNDEPPYEITLYWVEKEDGDVTVTKDTHSQRVYTHDEFTDAAEKAGLTCTRYWNWQVTEPDKEKNRVVYVCQPQQ